jgi:hypothetical protein
MRGEDGGGAARGVSRRRFLGGIGAGAAGAVTMGSTAGLVLMPPAAAAAAPAPAGAPTVPHGRFGRMFRMNSFHGATPQLRDALMDIGKQGGVLDAKDNLAAGPVALIVDPLLSANNPNNPSQTAGSTFLGQFLDHDVTFDTGSRMGQPTAPESASNGRTPALDLDSVYGAGPVGSPQLYEPLDRAMFRVEHGGQFEDLPRLGDNSAIVADPRNDENLIISGLQCAFLKFHNAAVQFVRSRGVTDTQEAFARARQLTTWHYQWMAVHEVLPQFVGQAMVDDVLLHGRQWYRPAMGEAFIPVEFQGAAYRMGHSMIRPSYRANLKGDQNQAFFAMLFDPAMSDGPDPADLSGGHRAARRFIGWQTFFDFGDGEVKPNKLIDTKLSSPLFALPMRAIASRDLPIVLPQRTLLRHVTWMLPSGQGIARTMGAPVLASGDLQELSAYGLGLEKSTPLFYYVLKEAELQAGGRHLGAVGGRIVAEVILGLLQTDPDSYMVRNPTWTPTLPRRDGTTSGDFGMVDFLTFAGVDPTSRGQ